MSLAALDSRSPFSCPPVQMESQRQQLFPFWNPSPNQPFPSEFGGFSGNNLDKARLASTQMDRGSEIATNGSSSRGRSKPRLVKVRRQQCKSTPVPPSNAPGLNPFQSVASENFNQVGSGASRASNGCNASIADDKVGKSDNVGFVFGKDSEKNPLTGNFGRSCADGVLKVSEPNLDSNSFPKHEESSGRCGGSECRKFENKGFQFGANTSGCSSFLNSKLENEKRCESYGRSGAVNSEELDKIGFVFGRNSSCSRATLVPEKKQSSGSVHQSGSDELGKFNDTGFVFAANNNYSALDRNPEQRAPDESARQLHSDECMKLKNEVLSNLSAAKLEFEDGRKMTEDAESELHKVKVTDVFKFGSSREKKITFNEITKLSGEMNEVNGGDSENYADFANPATTDNLDSVVNKKLTFVFAASVSTTSASGTSTACKLSDDMRKLTLNNCEKIHCSDSSKDANINTPGSSNHVFVFGQNQKSQGSSIGNQGNTSYDQVKDANLQGPGNDNADEEVDGINVQAIDDNLFVFGSSKDSTPKPFTFQAGVNKSSSGPQDLLNNDPLMGKVMNQSLFSSSRPGFEAAPVGRSENIDKFNFTATTFGVEASATDFRTPAGDTSCSFSVNLYPELNKKLEFGEKSRSKRWKKVRGKLRRAIPVQQQLRQNCVSKQGFQQNLESPGCSSPMDFSPYQQDNHAPSTKEPRSSADVKDDYLAANISESEKKNEQKDVLENDCERCSSDSPLEEVETKCTSSKDEQFSSSSGGVGVSSSMNREETLSKKQFSVASTTEDVGQRNFTFSASSEQEKLSATNRQNRKKYRMRVGCRPNCTSRKNDTASSSIHFSPLGSNFLHVNQVKDNERNMFNSETKGKNKFKGDEENEKQGSFAVTEEACEKWRIRGNQAYEKGNMSKAEEFYTKGIDSVPHSKASEWCIEPLVLCYSNRAAARMSCGRMREALGDCMMAAALNPNFHKVQIRAANCHLALGEVEDALRYFSKCLQSENDVCLDRRVIIEAANGQQKAQNVANRMNKCAELLRQRTSSAAVSALEIISSVLPMSPYSENFLEMKGEALLMLQRYEEVIQLCEQTLVIAEKNFSMVVGDNNKVDCGPKYNNSSIRLWRWRLISKSYFHLGKLEVALDFLEKQELLRSSEAKYGSSTEESSIPFAVTIRELLHHKNKGNEAFQCGRHEEAVKHYTAAVPISVESRPFAAICFCNRAAAYQALGQITDAIADCSLAIALDRSYTKAVSRRATLYETIRDYEQAASDLRRLISLLEKQSQENIGQSGTPDGQNGSKDKQLKQARSRLSLVEGKNKKGISLDHYLILGIKPSDTTAEIKKAYRKSALKHHPDKVGQFLARSDSGYDGQLWREIGDEVHKDADRLFKMIGEAYAVLSDETKRSQYDLEEELRNTQKESRASRGFSDFHSSPSENGANRRYSQKFWKTHGSSQYHW
ncbi:uncharacterized protein LOC127789991 [Diospyros lotus]|uniref:uncharacterized protein LOC127789991 n=1 Tax=Diospyros lotus TaxID=55363 RepID=UPI00225C1A2A|nr:uncharacterized protein LOC127789991 [Diospyros lotus]